MDAAKAGAGNLEIFVTSKGETVPNFVRQEGEAKFEVTFTPQTPENHSVTVNFNGDPVPGELNVTTFRYGKGPRELQGQ